MNKKMVILHTVVNIELDFDTTKIIKKENRLCCLSFGDYISTFVDIFIL